ncbi:MAG: SLBB domain-containing protein, partial [Longimicrobiales bacterium]|nr:SLBB domain-containing protein [Longimicrobiales bacterium]
LLFGLVTAGVLACVPASAQLPVSPQEAQRLLRENPELVRQQLLQSGLSRNEIRARLSAAGIPTDALDAFLSGEDIDPDAAFTPQAIEGLQALGLAVETADGLELVEVSTGMQRRALRDSLETGFPVFGHRDFRRATSQFQPLLSGPVPEDYRVGPGDQLLLLLTGEVEAAHDLTVTREGFVVIPNVGRVDLANLTMGEARALLRRRLAQAYSGIDRGTTTVSVSMSELRTIQVYVVGAVRQAGAYQLASVATVLNALYAADGPTELGNLRSVRVQRRSGEERVVDLYPYLVSGDITGDIGLQQGDVVHVPIRENRVALHGAVGRPAAYEVGDGEDLLDVLRYAGGFGPDANRRRLTIHRVARPGDRGPGLGERTAIDLALAPSDDPTDPRHVGGVIIPPVGLQDGDSIVVDSVGALADGFYVIVGGMVAKPDTFPWMEGMTIRDAVQLARGPVTGADLRAAEVTRLPEERSMGELAQRLEVPLDSSYLEVGPDGRYVGPPGVPFPPPGASPEFELAPYDQVRILQQPDFEMPRSVKIMGEVSVPGEYALLSKDDRVVDLVTRAGRILETGYPEGARLYRSQDEMGRIDLDLPEALANPNSDENVTLQPGDSLFIPVYSPTVQVQGAVNSPVTVLWRDGQDFDYYISAAGGLRSDADKGRSSVRYANGLARTRDKFLFWSSYPTPGPGSTINIPAENPEDQFDTRGLITDLVAILGSLTTVVVVLTR